MSLHAVPTLDELADQPDRVAELSRPAVWAALFRTFAIQQACFAVLVADGHSDRVEAIERAELLTLEEAAKRLLIGTSTLEQGWRDFPYRTFRVRMGRAVRYSAARIAEWIRDPDGYACRHAGSGEPGTAAAPRPRKRGPRIGRSALRPVRGGEGAPS